VDDAVGAPPLDRERQHADEKRPATGVRQQRGEHHRPLGTWVLAPSLRTSRGVSMLWLGVRSREIKWSTATTINLISSLGGGGFVHLSNLILIDFLVFVSCFNLFHSGDITCGGLFLSPVATMWDISRHGSSEQYSASPYLAGLLNCAVWLLYGYVHPNGKWVFGINIVGSLLQLLYIVIFVYYTTVDDVRYQIYYMLFGAGVCLVGIMALVFGQAHSTEQKCMGFGLAGVATGIGMYAAPLIQLVRTCMYIYYACCGP